MANAEKKQFQAESKRLLDLMIHSIYTHHEIFLRELISNASDAIDKLYFHAASENLTGLSRDDFSIELRPDKESRTLTIVDNGCGMTKEELENNLGTIAKSGSLDFKNTNELKDGMEIIGQFGVGFYSAFMVSSLVTVRSRAYGADTAWQWQSEGTDGYTVEPCEKAGNGTEIVLKIKENTEDEKYDEYLDPYRLRAIVKKYSDYIRYPIRMEMEHSHLKEGCDPEKPEYETHREMETLNSMVPIWRKNKNEVTAEEYNAFYQEKFFDFQAPLKVIHSSTEGAATYNALLFIPAKTYDYYTKEFEKGLQLYANGVLIMEKCADLLPDHFSFVKGLVDSQDLQLNISREMLQHDRQLKVIESRLEKKIKSELLNKPANDPDFDYIRLCTQYYDALSAAGVNADVVSYHADWSRYKLVVLPAAFVMSREIQQKVRRFVENGGTVVATFLTSVKNTDNVGYTDTLPAGLTDVFGATVEEVEPVFGQNVTGLALKAGNTCMQVTDSLWSELLGGNAEMIGRYTEDYKTDGGVVARNRFGAGTAYYVGTGLPDAALQALLEDICAGCGISPHPFTCIRDVEVVARELDGAAVYFLLNFSGEAQTVTFDGVFTNYVDGACYAGKMEIAKNGFRIGTVNKP